MHRYTLLYMPVTPPGGRDRFYISNVSNTLIRISKWKHSLLDNCKCGKMTVEGETNVIEQDIPAAKPVPILTFEILRHIKEAQQQHGLRHGDFQRYRGYCSRRIRRLRKVLKLPQGDRRHYKRRDVTVAHLEDPRADVRYLEICLMLTERAWAYAMQLRQESNTEPRKGFHLINRLRKATSCAIVLETLANTEYCDARTKLEAHAYKMWVHGTYQFEVAEWKSAHDNLTIAQKIYTELADSLPFEEQAPYRSRCEELTPSLRYCAYNTDGEKGIDAIGHLEGLNNLMQQAKQRRTEELSETEWRGNKFSVRPDRTRQFLIGIQNIENSLKNAEDNTKRIAILEQVLMDCKESINAVRDEMKTDPKLKSAPGEPLSGAQMLLSYLTYIRLTRTIDRNLCLIEQAKTDGKKTRPQDFARFYEIILQNITELQQLNGLENDNQYQAEISMRSKCFKGFRCFFMAKTLEGTKRFTDAFALYERSAEYANAILLDKASSSEQKEMVKGLLDDIDKNKFIAHAQAVLEELGREEEEAVGIAKKPSKKFKVKRPLVDRLDEYIEDPSILTSNPNVVKFPPEMKPVPCKPLFFDLAYNLIDFPDLEDKVDPTAKSKGKEQTGAGLTGFVKGLWGWGSTKK